DLRRAARHHPVEHALADIDKIIKAVGMPQRPFGKDEPGGKPLGLGRVQNCLQPSHSRPPRQSIIRRKAPPGPADLSIFLRQSGRKAMMKWRVGEVTVTKIVELEVTGGSRFILPQATR